VSSKGKKLARMIQINDRWCKRCGICIEFCPGKVFAQDSPQFPVVADLQACTVCRLCELRCPDYAISVKGVMGS